MPQNGRIGGQHLDEPVFAHARRDFTPLSVDQTVSEALEYLRAQRLGERIVYFYVTDGQGRLCGVVPTRRLLMADPNARLDPLMVRDIVTLPARATVRETCEAFLRHRFLALPVVDADGRLHGTADVSLLTGEIADFAEQQSKDDIFQLIGVHVARALTPWRSFTDRFPWLLANISGGLLAAGLASLYEPLLNSVIVLALFIPVVLALAESVSIQSVSLTLQSLHGARIDWSFFGAAIWKELRTASMLGVASGALVGSLAWIWKANAVVALAIGTSILLAMMTACVLGVALPAALRALRRDPRIAAGPIVLALADLATLLFYFHVSGLLLT